MAPTYRTERVPTRVGARVSQLVGAELTFEQLDGGPDFILMFYGIEPGDLLVVPPEIIFRALERRGVDATRVRPIHGIWGIRPADFYVHR